MRHQSRDAHRDGPGAEVGPTSAYDDVIMRTIVDLPEEQVKGLADLCKRQKISRAEAVRRALARMLQEEGLASRERAFGAWKKKRNSRALIEKLRREWTA